MQSKTLLAGIATQYFALGETEKAIELANIEIETDNTVADNYIVLYMINLLYDNLSKSRIQCVPCSALMCLRNVMSDM